MPNDVQIFVCRRGEGPTPAPVYCPCGMKATKACAFELRGPKAGQRCGKPLCQRCGLAAGAQERGGLCAPHARLAGKVVG